MPSSACSLHHVWKHYPWLSTLGCGGIWKQKALPKSHSHFLFHCSALSSQTRTKLIQLPFLKWNLRQRFLSRSQSSRRSDDDTLEEQIRRTSEDSRALRELMEGERGKLRQSLEELQRLHSQVSNSQTLHMWSCNSSVHPPKHAFHQRDQHDK